MNLYALLIALQNISLLAEIMKMPLGSTPNHVLLQLNMRHAALGIRNPAQPSELEIELEDALNNAKWNPVCGGFQAHIGEYTFLLFSNEEEEGRVKVSMDEYEIPSKYLGIRLFNLFEELTIEELRRESEKEADGLCRTYNLQPTRKRRNARIKKEF